MSTAQQQVRHGFTYLLPVLIGNLAPVLTLPIFTRILTPADYGAWALATARCFILEKIASPAQIPGHEEIGLRPKILY